MNTPDMIHRITHRKDGPDLDKAFQFQYMGSSQFEYGTLPRSIRALRLWDAANPLVMQKLVASTGEAVWYVGPEGAQEVAQSVLEQELKSRYSSERLEPTGIQFALSRSASASPLEDLHDYGADCWLRHRILSGRVRL